MVESLNSKVEIVVDGTSYAGFAQYGKIMIGNAGFEFYDDKKVSNFVQIPWEEIESVTVSVLFGGKWIPRFSIKTKSDGSFIFAAKELRLFCGQFEATLVRRRCTGRFLSSR